MIGSRQTGKEKTALAERAKLAGEAARGVSAKQPMTKAERQAEKNRQKMADQKNRKSKNPLMEVRLLLMSFCNSHSHQDGSIASIYYDVSC